MVDRNLVQKNISFLKTGFNQSSKCVYIFLFYLDIFNFNENFLGKLFIK